MGISVKDVELYLKVIKNRVEGNNSSEWIVRNYRSLLKTHKRFDAMQLLTSKMYEKQEKDYPVSTWSMINPDDESLFKKNRVVKHIMSSDIFSVPKKDSIALVLNIMKWKNIHHMPVINGGGELLGLVTWTDVENYLGKPKQQNDSISTIMKTDIVTIDAYAPIESAKKLMKTKNIGCLPVLKNNKLIGLVTLNDFDI
jgi:CBS domain-containing protein